jgi:hypothetical protein
MVAPGWSSDADQAGRDRIETSRGLIQEEQLWRMKQGSRQRESTPHTLGELGHAFVTIVVQSDTLGPRKPKTSPCATVKDTSRTAARREPGYVKPNA